MEIKTNSDRIRAMTDEELAEMLSDMTVCTFCPVSTCDGIARRKRICQCRWLEWLRSPAESEGET